LNNGSVPVAVSPGWEEDLPDVISAYLSLRAWTSTPAARVVHLPVSSHTTAAFPSFGPGRRSTLCRTATSVRRAFSGLQSFAHVQAHRFARHPDRSYRYGRTVWQPWLLRPSLSWVVTFPRPGYANRPNRAIDGMGTYTPSDTQPCRLLPERQVSGAVGSRSDAGA